MACAPVFHAFSLLISRTTAAACASAASCRTVDEGRKAKIDDALDGHDVDERCCGWLLLGGYRRERGEQARCHTTLALPTVRLLECSTFTPIDVGPHLR